MQGTAAPAERFAAEQYLVERPNSGQKLSAHGAGAALRKEPFHSDRGLIEQRPDKALAG